MKTTNRNPKPNSLLQPAAAFPRRRSKTLKVAALLAAFVFLIFGTTRTRAQGIPPGCSGSAIGISLFTSAPDVHIGDTLFYSVSVFNGVLGSPLSCDASNIVASITTPDGVIHPIALRRTYLSHTQSDFYTNVVSYVVRTADIRPDGSVRATAEDTAVIYQNDTPSMGGANQGVNTEVSQPCIQLIVQCVGGVGENGAITFTGAITNCGNNTLVGVTVTNYVDGGANAVLFPTNILRGQSVVFSGSYIPSNPCLPSTATLVAVGVDQFTANPRTVTSTNTTTCSIVTVPGIRVRKECPVNPTAPGQLLVYSGSVSNSGNITLSNIVVVNTQPALNTTVFTRASLAPGEVASFTASYPAPTNCSVTDILAANANSRCGTPVTSTVTTTCPILTTPQITVAEVCPATPGVSGGTSSFSGVVRNTGDVTLTNVTVIADRPAPGTVVLTVASLAPGASANYSGNFTVPLDVCTVTTTVRALGNDACTGAAVAGNASATCPVTTAPAIAVTLTCPVVPSTNGGLITYTGTVRNSGNVTLNNIVVTDSQASPPSVFTAATLAPGASANFTASFTAPANVCTVSSTVNALGRDNCSETIVSASATATCPLVPNPRLIVTQNCSGGPGSPGGVLNYSGTVRNAGDITLTNIVVTNDRTGATPVFTAAVLLPGATTNFTGSYSVPALSDCSITSTVTARGNDICSGSEVTHAASATCPVGTAPSVIISVNCSGTVIGPGGILTYSGSVSNSGNSTLTNVVVTSDRNGGTPVLVAASLAPGATVSFSGNFLVPLDSACSLTTVVTVIGRDSCSGIAAQNTASVTCPIIGTPRIVVTQTCPVIQVSPGDTLTYSGTVSNSGNVTLSNVVVTSDRTGATTVFSIASLAPRATASFTGSYVTHTDCCIDSSTLTATGRDCNNTLAIDTATRTCPLLTQPGITVTAVCAPEMWKPLEPGSVLTYSGIVSNSGNITLTNVTIVNNTPTNGTRVFGPITLAAGESSPYTASFVVPVDFCGTHTVTARGIDSCTLLPLTSSATTTCPITTTPSITVSKNCPALPTPYGGTFTFSGSVSNSGNVSLTNVFVVNDQPAPNTPVIGPITLAPGASANFSRSYPAPTECCVVTDTLTAHGQDSCAGTLVTDTATQICPLLTTPRIFVAENCPPTAVPVAVDGLYEYTGSITNVGDVVLTNVYVVSSHPVPNTVVLGPIELAPGESEGFYGAFIVTAASPQVIVTAAGLDACQARVVSAAANCSGPINPPNEPRAITVTITGNGTVTGVANGQILNIGQSYTATATPAAGSSFLNWSGGVASPSPVLTFVMQSNLVLTANFVFNGSNVFNPVAGTFNGLFFDTNDVRISSSGCFSLTMMEDGTYKATVQNKGKKYNVKGTFNANGQAQNTINRAGTNPLVVNWQGLFNDPDYLSGNVIDGGSVAQLAGGRDVFNAGHPAPQAGQYTLIIPGIVDSTFSPAGDGYGTLTVDAEGVVRLKGKLADGVVANQNVALSRNGEWPVCISLHGGKGILIGWLLFSNDGVSIGNDIAGTLRWIKPAIATGKLYKQGFSANSDAIGSHYVPPTGAGNMLQITDGVVTLSGGNLPFSINPVTFGPSSKLVNDGPNALKLTFTPSSGLFSGTFKDRGESKTYSIKGAVLQRQNYGSGYAPGADQSGRVVFQAAP